MKRIYRGRKLTPRESARTKEIRQQVMAEVPPGGVVPDDLPKFPRGYALLSMGIANGLKAARESKGVSLSEFAAQAGMNKAIVSRLESGIQKNPTVETLMRYAAALGMELVVELRQRR